MERRADIVEAKGLFGLNFIGSDEIAKIELGIGVQSLARIPEIPYRKAVLKEHADDSILILGSDTMTDGSKLNIMSLRKRFGTDPDVSEPCFYNQDWYIKEDFVKTSIEIKWYLIRKNVIEESRAVLPATLERQFKFPKAVLCAYTFFVYWFHAHVLLWKDDFVWCLDTDHNGDRVYVGRYTDAEGINKNGFNIHRHLALRNTYAAVSVY